MVVPLVVIANVPQGMLSDASNRFGSSSGQASRKDVLVAEPSGVEKSGRSHARNARRRKEMKAGRQKQEKRADERADSVLRPSIEQLMRSHSWCTTSVSGDRGKHSSKTTSLTTWSVMRLRTLEAE